MPEVSVIIPTYNRADLVTQSIDSVLAQTFADFEIVIIDDGSQDNTDKVISRTYQDARVRYIYQQNTGLGGARNAGIRAATGRYVLFLDADDVLLPTCLESQVAMLNNQPELGLVLGGFVFIDEHDQPLLERHPWTYHPRLDLDDWLLNCPPFVPTGMIVHKTWLDRIEGFDPQLRRAEDRDLCLRLAEQGCQMAWNKSIICGYRVHSGQMVNDGHSQKNITLHVLDKLFDSANLPQHLQEARPQIYAGVHMEGAFREFGANQLEYAQQSMTRAIQDMPSFINGNPPALMNITIGWAINPITGDPTAFVQRVLDNLPPAARRLTEFRERILFAAVILAAVEACQVNNTDLARRYLADAAVAGNLLNENPALAIELLGEYVRATPPERHPEIVSQFFMSLPSQMASLSAYRRKLLGRLHIAEGFQAHQRGDLAGAAQNIRAGVRHDPAWLRNRGIWSIMWQSLVGPRKSDGSQ